MGRRRRSPAAGPPRPAPPELAGHEIVGPVGYGANGAVWSARDGAGQDVVVSVLALPRGDAGTAQLRRLAALRHGSHPHLARIRRVVGLDGDRCAVVCGRVRGPTLATVVSARGPLAPAELAGLLAGVGSALGYLHERGVVHGDVAPANVVIADDGAPVLVDLAGHGAHELGTPGFVPPERSRGSVAGAPGDVWALARLVEWAAGPDPVRNLPTVLAPALDADPARRPGARDLASRAPELAPAAPVSVPPAAALAQARMRDDLAPTQRRARIRRPGARSGLERRPRAAPGPTRAAGGARTRPADGVRETGGTLTGSAWSSRGPRSGSTDSAHGTRGPRPASTDGPGGTRGSRSGSTDGARGLRDPRSGSADGVRGIRDPRPGPTAAGRRPPPRASRRTPRHVSRRALPAAWLGAAVSLGVAALLTGLIAWSAPDERAAGYGHRFAASIEDLEDVHVLGELLARRDGALLAGDAEALAATTVPGGPAARADVVLLDRLAATGTTLEGLRTTVTSVVGVTRVEEGVAVDAVLAQGPHEREVDGAHVTVPAQPPQCVRTVLVPGAGQTWQLLRAEPCP